MVVSEDWRSRLRADYGVEATVIHNGVDAGRFPPIDAVRRRAVRREVGVDERFVFLAVGGIEPRKGSVFLLEAMAALAGRLDPAPAVVVVGGHSFQDYTQYREDALAMLPGLGLQLGRDVILAGTVTDERLHELYRSADALVFPSVKEGWGLAVLEAMTADLPVVASDIAVLREYLVDHENALLTRAGDVDSLAAGMEELIRDADLRSALASGGRALVPAYSWERAATEHEQLYAGLQT